MNEELIKTFIQQGAWALLFVWLLFDTRKDSKAREEKYQQTIDKLADKLSVVEVVKEKIEKIEEKIFN